MTTDAALVLNSAGLRLRFASANGVLCSCVDVASGIDLIAEPRLAGNFRLLLPLPEREANYIAGRDQALTRIEQDRNTLALHWDGPLQNELGVWDLAVTLRVECTDAGIRFRLRVENRTQHPVAEVWYTMLGGIQGFGPRPDTESMIPQKGWSAGEHLFSRFPLSFQYGTPYPEFRCQYPFMMPMPWIDFHNRNLGRGLYCGCHDTEPRIKYLRLELQPGVERRADENWPQPEHLDPDEPLGLQLHWILLPWTAPGETFEAPPVVVQTHAGDWHQGAAIYRDWFTGRFPLTGPNAASWITDTTALQGTMLLLQEGVCHRTYAEIPNWAAAAARYGINTVLLCGWDRGGHDADYPHYEPDPRLGSWADLRDAVAGCHALGVRVLFFVNIQTADCTTDWYRRELHRYRSVGRWGCPHNSVGYGMGTFSGRAGITHRPLADLNPGFAPVRELLVRQFRKLAEIGADGLHIDKVDAPLFDFAAELDTSPDLAAPAGVLRTIRETLAACRELNPAFAVSTECRWDQMLPLAPVGWSWHSHVLGEKDHIPVFKAAFPEWIPTMAIEQPFDYNLANSAIRFGYALLVAPGHFTASMHDPLWQPLSRYIQELERLRRGLHDIIFRGQFQDRAGVRIDVAPPLAFSVHARPDDGRRACIMVNPGTKADQAVLAEFRDAATPVVRIYRPFADPVDAECPITLDIPGNSLVIALEAAAPDSGQAWPEIPSPSLANPVPDTTA